MINGDILGLTVTGGPLILATLNVDGGHVRGLATHEFSCLAEMLGHIFERPRPLGIAIDQVLALGMCDAGWRPVDFYLHDAPFHHHCPADEFPFFWGPYQCDGMRSLVGIGALSALRRRWPNLPATETAPQELYTHFARCADWPVPVNRVRATVADWIGGVAPDDISHPSPAGARRPGELRVRNRAFAGLSALAMWKGISAAWTRDLHQLWRDAGVKTCTTIDAETVEIRYPRQGPDTLIFPAGVIQFTWPQE